MAQTTGKYSKSALSSSFVMMGLILLIILAASGFSFINSPLVHMPSMHALNPYYEGEMIKEVLPAIFGRRREELVEVRIGTVVKASHQEPPIKDSDVTILIKTMDRPSCLKHLVTSLREQHPNIPIIVADDGKKSSAESVKGFKDVLFYRMQYDSGLSAGRNLMLSQVETAYVLMLDDDFTWDKNILKHFIHVMERHPHLDLVGGRAGLNFAGIMHITNSTLFLVKGNKGILEDTSIPSTIANGGADGIAENFGSPCVLVDFVPNFFLARTDTLLKLQWDNNLKVGEHEEFFIRFSLGKYRAAYCASVYVENQQDKCNEANNETLIRKQNRSRTRAFIKKGLYHLHTALERDLSRLLGTPSTALSQTRRALKYPYQIMGVKCDQCAPGFTGPQCDQCAPNHYGLRCVPCACAHGACVVDQDGNDQIVSCKCEKGWFGVSCDAKLQVGSNLILDPDFTSLKSTESAVGLWQTLRDGCITWTGSGIWLMNDGFKVCGASYAVELNQEKPLALVISVEGKGMGVAPVKDPLMYSLYYDVTYQDGSVRLAQRGYFYPQATSETSSSFRDIATYSGTGLLPICECSAATDHSELMRFNYLARMIL